MLAQVQASFFFFWTDSQAHDGFQDQANNQSEHNSEGTNGSNAAQLVHDLLTTGFGTEDADCQSAPDSTYQVDADRTHGVINLDDAIDDDD